MRIQELERRGNMMESSAARIYQKGMEMREEYVNQVQHLQGLLGNTEDRLRQMETNSEFANGVAEKLYADGREMRSPSHRTWKLVGTTYCEWWTDELAYCSWVFKTTSSYVRRERTTTGKRVTKKSPWANQARLESDHRLRNAEFEIVRRTDMNRNAENEAIARLRMEPLMSSNIEMQLEHYEAQYNDEKLENTELRTHLSEQDTKL